MLPASRLGNTYRTMLNNRNPRSLLMADEGFSVLAGNTAPLGIVRPRYAAYR